VRARLPALARVAVPAPRDGGTGCRAPPAADPCDPADASSRPRSRARAIPARNGELHAGQSHRGRRGGRVAARGSPSGAATPHGALCRGEGRHHLCPRASRGCRQARAALHALAAPVLLLVPAAYVLRSFFQFYFYAQVVSETFAMAMVLAALAWMRTRARRHLWLAAACGVGVFLSWPVWIVPAGAAVLTAIVAVAPSVRSRISDAAVVVVPVALFACLHASTHAAGTSILGSAGAVTRPSPGPGRGLTPNRRFAVASRDRVVSAYPLPIVEDFESVGRPPERALIGDQKIVRISRPCTTPGPLFGAFDYSRLQCITFHVAKCCEEVAGVADRF
jgi:hypothetical protein